MGITIDVLLRPVTEDEVFEQFLAILETLQVPARSWRRGGVARTILRVVARTYTGFADLIAAAIRGGFLDTAEGDWLTLLAKYVYGVDRIEATFATGRLELSNNGGGLFSFKAGEVRALGRNGKAYVNVAAFSLNPGEKKLADCIAVELGSSSSAPAESIVELETVLPRVSIRNPAAFVGVDAEPDPDLRQRCRDRRGSWSLKGPRSAYADAVRRARRPDGSSVGINRLSISASSSTGEVVIYAASPAGAPPAADLELARQSIEELARPDTVTVSLIPAFELPLRANLTLWARKGGGVAANDVAAAAQAALIREISGYPIGGIKKTAAAEGMLYADFVKGVVKASHPAVFDVDGLEADIVIRPGGVATLAASVTVNLVDVEAA